MGIDSFFLSGAPLCFFMHSLPLITSTLFDFKLRTAKPCKNWLLSVRYTMERMSAQPLINTWNMLSWVRRHVFGLLEDVFLLYT